MNRLFCYGTLQVPEVIQTVTGRIYTGKSATLDGYARYRVKNTEYPGIIRVAGCKTKGFLYENVSIFNDVLGPIMRGFVGLGRTRPVDSAEANSNDSTATQSVSCFGADLIRLSGESRA